MQTPCIDICKINPLTQMCIGCGRTSTEIAGWRGYTDEQREQIMAELPVRMFGD